MTTPLLIQIVGPIRAETINGVRENIERARQAMIEILKRGHYVICPHTMMAFLNGLMPEDHFLKNAIRLLEGVDAVYPIQGWTESAGSIAEIEVAREIGLKRFFSLDDIQNLRDSFK
jgi:hypothetical protein